VLIKPKTITFQPGKVLQTVTTTVLTNNSAQAEPHDRHGAVEPGRRGDPGLGRRHRDDRRRRLTPPVGHPPNGNLRRLHG
jgi:hypothetical protein